ncbi:hypothetical protein GPECTOR_75g725 [Gonium pectorale]|uniref:Uncharacterized protein n=1 Tax=Gonium pectorale TaxID=33097 RepID=A0A150G2B0_GONPE|nr:hypothetical protein GPECTOR_75g725 [Gonium pectorale]|eukprot:KXZ44002.1 hypothetical protein GPECTOR_75g725 [Gonium pectorale]
MLTKKLQKQQVGESVTATVTVRRVSGRRVTFATTAVVPATGVLAIDGDALALMPAAANSRTDLRDTEACPPGQ